jgi:hypothetical protein
MYILHLDLRRFVFVRVGACGVLRADNSELARFRSACKEWPGSIMVKCSDTVS